MPLSWLPRDVTDVGLGIVRTSIAAAGVVMLWISYRQRKSGASERSRRWARGLLATLGLLAVGAYYNFFIWYQVGGAHIHELFHYYLGSKYAHELGYTRIYECATVADAEDQLPAEVVNEPIRDLVTKEVVSPAELLAHPDRCTSHFLPARWAEFKHDLRWFRSHTTATAWSHIRQDHGYNPSPVWTLLGGAASKVFPATDAGMAWVANLDLVLVIATFAAIGWAFGLEAAALAMLTFGTSFPARFAWTGAAFLRQMWFSSSLIGICMLRRGRPAVAGGLLATAAVLRIFPVFFFAGLGCRAAAALARTRRLDRNHLRVGLGALLVGGLLVLASIPAVGQGPGIYREFWDNTTSLIRAPAANNMGLRTVLTFRGTRPPGVVVDHVRVVRAEDLAEQRAQAWHAVRPFYLLIVVGIAFLFCDAAIRVEDWEAAAMGFALMPILTDPASYYFSFVTAAALLATRRPRIGPALMLTAIAGWASYFTFTALDHQYVATSFAILLFCVYVLFEMREAPFDDSRRGLAARSVSQRDATAEPGA